MNYHCFNGFSALLEAVSMRRESAAVLIVSLNILTRRNIDLFGA